MHCVGCALNIENALRKEKGIKSANVNFPLERLDLEFEPGEISFSRIQKIIEGLGYKVMEESEEALSGLKKEIERKKRRFLFALIFSLPTIYLVMGEMLGLPVLNLPFACRTVIQFLSASAVILSSFPIWRSGFKNLLRFHPNMDSLIFIGTAVAYLYSLVISAGQFLGKGMEGHLYYESAVFILVFVSLGRYLEAITKGKTGEAIEKLTGLQPKEATVLRGEEEVKIPISEVKVGDILLIKPGERIPVDGVVLEGYSAVDEKAITGESIPVEKKEGDEVIGGTINQTGILKFRATRIGADTVLAQIIKIVSEAMGSKAPIQILADRLAFYFVPGVIGVALLAFLIWLLFGYPLSFALTVLLSVLIIACPCALGLATPTAVMMGTGLGAKNGILIKSGKALEIAQNIDTFIFDKTGTLTRGEPVVSDIIPIKNGLTPRDILQIAATVERNSEHPLAQAILNRAREEGIELLAVSDFQTLPGFGVSATWQKRRIIIGTKRLMLENQIDPVAIEEKINLLEKEGKTVMILAEEKEIIGLLAVADPLKDYAKEVVAALQKMGKEVILLTGDNKRVGEAIAQLIGIEQVLAEVLPQEKSSEVKRLQSEGKKVAMVGDGINDAPALAQADLGVALGSGTDIALETGDIILINNDLRDLVKAIDLSRYTLKKIKQNLFWAFFYNTISIPIAAGVLFPFTGWLLSPAIAAGAMAFSSVSVVLNSLLMRRYRLKLFNRGDWI